MSRLQLAINVTDLEKAIEFYSKMFGATPAKVKTGYANFAIADPPLKLVLFEGPGGGDPQSSRGRGRHRGGGPVGRGAPEHGRARDHGRRRHRLLLRREDGDLDQRSRWRALGVVHQIGGCRAAPRHYASQPSAHRRKRPHIHDVLLLSSSPGLRPPRPASSQQRTRTGCLLAKYAELDNA